MIYIYERDGDAEDFDRDDAVSAGDVVKTCRYSDGEEMLAVQRIASLMAENKHFDVRHEIY